MYNGEVDILRIRLEELYEVVDEFILLEFNQSFSGKPKKQKFDPKHFYKYSEKLKTFFISADTSEREPDPWARESFQRNYFSNLIDTSSGSLVLLSDVDEIPSREAIRQIREKHGNDTFYGFQLQLHYFVFDYINVSGPAAKQISTVAFPANYLEHGTADQARKSIKAGEQRAETLYNSGWHFSYFSDFSGLKTKIQDFSHQEFNSEEFFSSVDINQILTLNLDLFSRQDHIWQKYTPRTLPKLLQHDLEIATKYTVRSRLGTGNVG